LILEKRPSVGVLRTLGATERTILVIFLEVGMLIGIGGTILGNVLGLGLSWAVNHYHLLPPPAGTHPVASLQPTIDHRGVGGVTPSWPAATGGACALPMPIRSRPASLSTARAVS